LFRADRDVAKKNKSYRAMVDRCRRSVTSGYRVATALSRDASSRVDLLENADFQRALQLIKESAEKSPDSRGSWHWALFQHADPAEAKKIAQYMKTSEYAQLNRGAARLFTSINGNTALSTFWEGQALGDETEGRAALDRCKAKGVPLPFDGK
jgi:hypothetical protein